MQFKKGKGLKLVAIQGFYSNLESRLASGEAISVNLRPNGDIMEAQLRHWAENNDIEITKLGDFQFSLFSKSLFLRSLKGRIERDGMIDVLPSEHVTKKDLTNWAVRNGYGYMVKKDGTVNITQLAVAA